MQNINGLPLKIPLITIDRSLERLLQYTQRAQGTGGMMMEPGLAERLHQSIAISVKRQEVAGRPAVLLVPGVLEPKLARFARDSIPNVRVSSYDEIPNNKQISMVAVVGRPDT